MAELRIKNGLALGPFGGTIAYQGLGTSPNFVNPSYFSQANTAPDVTNGVLFLTQNTTNTVINAFIADRGARLGGVEEAPDGKVIFVFFTDNSTSIASTRNIFLSNTATYFNSGSVISFIQINSGWYEMFRSNNSQSGGAAGVSQPPTLNYSIAGSASINVNNVSMAVLIGTMATVTLRSISGGAVGQVVNLVQNNTNGITIQIETGGNIFIPGTSHVLMNNSGMYSLIMGTGLIWRMDRPVA